MRVIPHASQCAVDRTGIQPQSLECLAIKNTFFLQDPACNSKLLALCGAGMLSSIATLIHDTYLPVYLQDVLGLSNTRVRSGSEKQTKLLGKTQCWEQSPVLFPFGCASHGWGNCRCPNFQLHTQTCRKLHLLSDLTICPAVPRCADRQRAGDCTVPQQPHQHSQGHDWSADISNSMSLSLRRRLAMCRRSRSS